MKRLNIIYLTIIFPLLLWGCIGQPGSQAAGNNDPEGPRLPQEEYALEKVDNAYWQIQHDSEYYKYFNEIHESFYQKIMATQDPEELRQLYIERDLEIALKRQEFLAQSSLVEKVIGGTASLMGTNPTGHLFRMGDIRLIPQQRFSPSDPSNYQYKKVEHSQISKATDSMTAIIQFDRQLKERGIELIVVPVPNSSQLYAHQLEEGIKLEEVVWHPWAYMISGLLENDVEVLDLLDLYKTYTGDNTALNYIDHHWGQAGLDIAAWELSKRLERFHFKDSHYLDPESFSKEPIMVPTPSMILHWDHIALSFIENNMPYHPLYQRDQIFYKNNPIKPAPSFEDSPVLIMGDSFIPHAEETSSGIYAHLAYYSGIIPAAFSRDAGAAEPPEFFRRYVAGKGKEPKVVIWEIYGSAMGEITNLNDWRVVSIPEAAPALESDAENEVPSITAGGAYWVEGEIIRVSNIPLNTESLDYPDALYTYKLRILDGGESGLPTGERILVYSQFMKDYQLIEDHIINPLDRGRFQLESWSSATSHVDKIGTMQLVDELEDYMSDIYFVHQVE